MGKYAPLTVDEKNKVAQAVIPETSNALWRKLPLVIVDDYRAGYKAATYGVSPFSTAAPDGDGEGLVWQPGMSVAEGTEIEDEQILVRTKGVASKTIKDFLDKPRANRIGTYQNKGPTLNSQIERSMDMRAVNSLQSPLVNAATIDVTGGAGSPLNSYPASATPFETIETALRPLRVLRDQGAGLTVEAFLTEEDILVFGGYEEYNHLLDSGNAPARRPKQIDLEPIVATFKRKHKLDEVHIVDVTYDDSFEGRAENLVRGMTELVIVLLDRERTEWDLTEENSDGFGPQGGFAMSASQKPTSRIWTDDEKGTEHMHVWGMVGFFSPHQQAFSKPLGVRFNNLS